MSKNNDPDRFKTIARVNWVCTFVDTLLSVLKLSIGIVTRSPGLIADGLHSLSDLGTDILALILGKLAQHGPDEDHPYGHARYETMGTAILGTILMMVAAGIGIENFFNMLRGESLTPHWLALVTAAISIVSKEALFHYTMKYARITRSNLLEANAWHSRTDSLSSIVVFIGILCSMIGFPIIEYFAALSVAVLIGIMGFKLAWNAMQDLIDRGVPPEQQEAYIDTVQSVPDVVDVHLMRTRLMGTDVIVDAHVQVAPTLSVSEAHQINDFATLLLSEKHPEITDVTLHVDFESDHHNKATQLRPKRREIKKKLSELGISGYERMYLHYANDLLNIELLFTKDIDKDIVLRHCQKIAQSEEWINSIEVYQQVSSTEL